MYANYVGLGYPFDFDDSTVKRTRPLWALTYGAQWSTHYID
jgi:hypothetical protein